jgi:hypothetical protein
LPGETVEIGNCRGITEVEWRARDLKCPRVVNVFRTSAFAALVALGFIAAPTSAFAQPTKSSRAATAKRATGPTVFDLLVKNGRLLEARAVLRARIANAPPASRAKAQAALERFEKRIPRLVVRVPQTFSGRVLVDGADVDPHDFSDRKPSDGETGAERLKETLLELDPGEHEITSIGARRTTERVKLDERERHIIVLGDAGATKTAAVDTPPEPAPSTPPPSATDPKPRSASSSLKTAGFIGLGASGAALAVGGVFAFLAAGDRSELSVHCPNDRCSESERDSWDRGRARANIATVAIVGGAVGAAASVSLLVFGSRRSENAVELQAAPTALVLRGRFQ